MLKCKYCNSDVPDEDNFCRYCGNRVKPKPSPYISVNSPKSEYQMSLKRNRSSVSFIKATLTIMMVITFVTIIMIAIGFFVDESTIDDLDNVIRLMTKIGTFIR